MPQISSGKLKGVMTLLSSWECEPLDKENDVKAVENLTCRRRSSPSYMQDLSEVMALTPPNLSGLGLGHRVYRVMPAGPL